MAGFRKSYLEEMARIHDRVQAVFDELLLRSGVAESAADGPDALPGSWSPAVDVLETDDTFVLYAELPGVERADVDLTVEGRRLELSGRRPPLPSDRAFARMERSYGRFRRVFELPDAVDPDRIAASLERGILRVELPKRRPKERGTIPIEEGGGA